MNKKLILLPAVLVTLGCMVGCNSNQATEEIAKAQKSDYFYDFTNEEYDKLFEIPSGMSALDQDIAFYVLNNSLGTVVKANQLDFNTYKGRTVSTSNEFYDGLWSDTMLDVKEREGIRISYTNPELEAIAKFRDFDYIVNPTFSDSIYPYLMMTQDKSTRIRHNKTSYKLYDNKVLDTHNETKNTYSINGKYTINDVDETYDTTIFAQDRKDQNETGLYYKVNANYYGIEPEEYYDTYKKVDYSEGKKAEFEQLIEDNFTYMKENKVVKEILKRMKRNAPTATTTLGLSATGKDYLNQYGTEHAGSFVSLYDDNHIYIYNSETIPLLHYGLGNMTDAQFYKLTESNMIKHQDSLTYAGDYILESYFEYLKIKSSKAKDPYTASMYESAINALNSMLYMFDERGIAFIQNPKKLITSYYDFETIGANYAKIFEFLLPVYSSNETVVILTKINDNWCVTDCATKQASKLLKNEKGVVLDKPISYSANYQTYKLNYDKFDAKQVSVGSNLLNEPLVIGAVQYTSLDETRLTLEAAKSTDAESGEGYTPIKIDKTYGPYYENISISSDIDYTAGSYGIYDTTIYDKHVRTDLPEDVHVYRGYIKQISDASKFGLRVYDYSNKGVEPTVIKKSLGYDSVTKILDTMGNELDPSGKENFMCSNDEYYALTDEWNESNHRINFNGSASIYVTLYLNSDGTIYNNIDNDYGFILELSNLKFEHLDNE